MPYNLTESQKNLVRWMVQENRNGTLPEEFIVSWTKGGCFITSYQGKHPELSRGALDALDSAGLVTSDISYQTKTSRAGGTSKRPKFKQTQTESSRRCTLMASTFEAVNSDFDAPDTSFVTQLTPLANVTNLDDGLKERCLPTLGAGSANPKMWDTAVRTAVVVLEERLRDVGGIGDENLIGRNLVNKIFNDKGTLAGEFNHRSEQQSYRELYGGTVGVLRNRYAHRLVDPTPEDGGASIVFVNLLLKMLDELRQQTTP